MSFGGRKLLYHRGVDDSPGTYVTDYVLFAQCLMFVFYFVYLFWKCKKTTGTKEIFAKSTYAVGTFFFLIGIASLVAGLTHQFLQTVEPYNPEVDMSWLILWRAAAALSGAMAFVFLLLAQHLLSSENILKFNRAIFIIYYVVAGLLCAAIAAHSFFILKAEHPWSLTVTFSLVFACSFYELIVASVVLWKRFKVDPLSQDALSLASSNDTISLYQEGAGNSDKLNNRADCTMAENVLNNNKPQPPTYRIDLLLHCIAPTIFLLAGIFQLMLGRFGNCSHHDSPETIGCPLPDEFNHNAVFHILQTIALSIFFVAEVCAVQRRCRIKTLRVNSFRRSADIA